jgi:hypothetical protein
MLDIFYVLVFSEILVSDIFSFAGKMKFRCDMKILWQDLVDS